MAIISFYFAIVYLWKCCCNYLANRGVIYRDNQQEPNDLGCNYLSNRGVIHLVLTKIHDVKDLQVFGSACIHWLIAFGPPAKDVQPPHEVVMAVDSIIFQLHFRA